MRWLLALAAAFVAAVPAVALLRCAEHRLGTLRLRRRAAQRLRRHEDHRARTSPKLVRLQVQLDGTVDSSPIYLHGRGGHDASSSRPPTARPRRSTRTPARCSGGSRRRRTRGSPARRRSRTPRRPHPPIARRSTPRPRTDASGSCGCPTARCCGRRRSPAIRRTRRSRRRLNVSRGLVIVTTGGYIGDAPPYQGHVVTMSEKTGRIAHVWNSLCSEPPHADPPEHVPGQRFGDLVAERRGRRSGERRPRRRHRQRSVQRVAPTGATACSSSRRTRRGCSATGRRPTRNT